MRLVMFSEVTVTLLPAYQALFQVLVEKVRLMTTPLEATLPTMAADSGA